MTATSSRGRTILLPAYCTPEYDFTQNIVLHTPRTMRYDTTRSLRQRFRHKLFKGIDRSFFRIVLDNCTIALDDIDRRERVGI